MRAGGGLLAIALAGLLGLALPGLDPAAGQTLPAPAGQPPSAAPARALDAAGFLRLAHSSAVLQARASELAASRDTRPEVRAFAQRMVAFRREQVGKLEAAARANGLAVPTVQDFEHQSIFENLEPLDQLELSRRYAELEVQALRQELQIYAAGEGASAEWVKSLVGDLRPSLQQLSEAAAQMRQSVGP